MRAKYVPGTDVYQLLHEFGSTAIAEGIWVSIPEPICSEAVFPENYVLLMRKALQAAKTGCAAEPRSFIQLRQLCVGKHHMLQIRYSCTAAEQETLENLEQAAKESRCFFRCRKENDCVRLQLAAECA